MTRSAAHLQFHKASYALMGQLGVDVAESRRELTPDGRGGLCERWTFQDRAIWFHALRYLQAQSFVIGERIGVMGWSHGGGTVFFAIAPSSIARPTDLPKGDFRASVAF